MLPPPLVLGPRRGSGPLPRDRPVTCGAFLPVGRALTLSGAGWRLPAPLPARSGGGAGQKSGAGPQE